jgi:amidase
VDLLTLTIEELQSLLSCGAVSSVAVTAKYLDQIEKHNHAGLKLNAVITVALRETALEDARQRDEERQRGVVRGPLHGVPILVKVKICLHRVLPNLTKLIRMHIAHLA